MAAISWECPQDEASGCGGRHPVDDPQEALRVEAGPSHPDPVEHQWAREELAWWVPKARQGLEAIGAM